MQVLDNFTLAFFKDMGWYAVDDSYIEPFIWGKNSGCFFARSSYCNKIQDGEATDRFLCAERYELDLG